MGNMFEKNLVVYSDERDIEAAWSEADALLASALAGDYRRTEPKTLAAFLRHALFLQDEHDLCSLLRRDDMPFDACAAMIWQPCYAVSAAGIWLALHSPELMDIEMAVRFSRLLTASFQTNFAVHGWNGDALRLKIIRMLDEAGAKRLAEKMPALSSTFTEHIAQFWLPLR